MAQELLIAVVVAFLGALMLALPITEVAMGAKFKSEVVCDTSVVPIPAWLIVKGTMNIVLVCLLGLFGVATMNDDQTLMAVVNLPIMLIGLFQFAWLIVGSVAFWRDCDDLEPGSVNTLMWCSLIIGYVFLFTGFVSSRSKKD